MIAPARVAAFEILLAVERRAAFASELLHGERVGRLAMADRRLATMIVMGALRWRGHLDYIIERIAGRPSSRLDAEVRVAMWIGIYQLRFLSRVPARAAVHDSVELAKYAGRRSAAGLVNAVLRRCPSDPIEALLAGEADPATRRAVELSHPEWLTRRWDERFGTEVATRIAEYDNSVPPVAVRVDTRHISVADCRNELTAAGLEVADGEIATDCLRIVGGDVTQTPAFRDGRIWVQDEASQLVALLLEASGNDRVLDCCAAPGGKMAAIVTSAPDARVTAMDVHPHRVRLLRRLLREDRVALLAGDATRRLPLRSSFERVLVDAPCSGTGTLGRNPEIRWRLTPEDIAALATKQATILGHALEALAPRGRLLYSVCSLEPEEGRELVERILNTHAELRLLPAREAIARLESAGRIRAGASAGPAGPAAIDLSGDFLQTVPGVFPGDGFFAAILEKSEAGRRAQ
jgi:16S rRNA (cytosine967-C5)-methyltransferase